MNSVKKFFNSLVCNDKETAEREFHRLMNEKLAAAKGVRKVSLTAEIFNQAPIKESNELNEATFDASMKKAIAFHEKGNKKRARYHLDSARTARYTLTSKEIFRHSDLLDKYNELRKIYKESKSKELSEAVSAKDFLKGGNGKIDKATVDDLLGDIYDSSSMTKTLVRNAAYQKGEDNPKATNPYKKDTFDYHLYQLGQEMEQSRA